ncbi:hypothetical protein B5D82_02235 [Cognaticolwellia beringensis]|uniref:Uncharacterized protein n=1 Tax=Cognaticolwellia beringensis TaxID=1967665 RepID=A0A222G5T3_9GAMM|nr:hypothetical protein B5D82_02235 [Cognaticolwellia beringensis]
MTFNYLIQNKKFRQIMNLLNYGVKLNGRPLVFHSAKNRTVRLVKYLLNRCGSRHSKIIAEQFINAAVIHLGLIISTA